MANTPLAAAVQRRTKPFRGRRVTRADRGRSLRSWVSAARRFLARSLCHHGSRMRRERIGAPDIHLARVLSRSHAAPPDRRSSTTAAAPLRQPSPSLAARHAVGWLLAADRLNETIDRQPRVVASARDGSVAGNARTVHDRRASSAGRGKVLCVSTAAARGDGPSNGRGGKRGGKWAKELDSKSGGVYGVVITPPSTAK